MNRLIHDCIFRLVLTVAVVVVPMGSAMPAQPVEVQPFDPGTWSYLMASARVPTAVVFTTTDCAHCPATFERLSQVMRGRPSKAALIGVVMDQASATELADHPHYRLADRLYGFVDLPAAKLRFAINPQWRGVTPYVALISPSRPPIWITGTPTVAQIQTWLATLAIR